MRRKFLVADLLCGAGGSSTGCARALAELGLKMELVCVNHWGVAIETHKRNHPEARHYCQDIATVRPHIVVPEGYLDLLMASPTCTHHSVARGGKPTSDQQRSDPWHIITWFTELRVKRAIIENVWEYIGWGPVDSRTGKPIKSRKGEYYRAWIDTIWKLGATSIEWRKLNAADFGDATTRQRYIAIIRFDGKPISWPVPTHRKREATLELFPGMKPWRPAREVIDWSIKGRSIFDRKKPLALKTLARIYAGAVKFKWPEPFLVRLRNHMAVAAGLAPKPDKPWIRELEVRGLPQPGTPEWEATLPLESGEPAIVTLHNHLTAQSIAQPMPAIMASGTHIGLAQPIMLANRTNNAAKNPDDSPVPCLTTAAGGGVAVAEPVVVNMKGRSTASGVDVPLPTQTSHAAHVFVAEPFVVSPRHGKEGAGPQPRAVSEPLPTLTAGGSQVAVAEPVIVNGRRNNKAKPVSTDPLPALDTKGGVWLAEPFVMATGSSGIPRSADEPIPTITTGGAGAEDPGCARPMLVEPFVLSRHGGGAPRSVDEPTPTQCAKHSQVLIAPYYGSGSGESCHSADDPVPSPTTKARFGIVVPITHADGSNRARDVEHDPLPTLTTANRGELAFITAQHGEREGQAPRVHSVDDPAPTIAASGHVDLIEATAEEYDILFRMLEPHELAAAMGFNSDDAAYEFAGTKTEQIKQIGNAVSVAKMRACVLAIAADAAPKPKAVRLSFSTPALTAAE